MNFHRPTKAIIDLAALHHNIVQLRQVPGAEVFFCPMIKANAYGHGDSGISKALQDLDLDTVGVCLIEEAQRVRKAGFHGQILLFGGFFSISVEEILQLKLTPVVTTWEQLEILKTSKLKFEIHLKFDTGMNRLGFAISEVSKLVEFLKTTSNLKLDGILTHLARGEDAHFADGMTSRQAHQFLTVVQILQAEFGNQIKVHALNTAAIVHKAQALKQKTYSPFIGSMNWGFRPGIGIYGVNPIENGFGLNLRPVLSLKTKIIQVRNIQSGEGVSYNSTWTASSPTRVAVLPVGYADGIHRILSNKEKVIVNGEMASVVGNICMDFMMIDLGPNSLMKVGDEVILIGESGKNQIRVETLAQSAGTISWEILTSIGPRVHREFLSLNSMKEYL